MTYGQKKYATIFLALIVILAGFVVVHKGRKSVTQVEYGDTKYLTNMVYHKFARKDAPEKRLKNPRIVLKAKNANLNEYDWDKYIPDIQEKIKKIKLNNVTDKNYIDEYVRINKEFAESCLMPAGFIETGSIPFDSMEYIDLERAQDELNFETGCDVNAQDKARIDWLTSEIKRCDPENSPYGSRSGFLINTTGLVRYDSEEMKAIREKFKAALEKQLPSLDALKASHRFFNEVRNRLYCVGSYSEFEYPGLEKDFVRYVECLANKDMTRRYLTHTIKFDDLVANILHNCLRNDEDRQGVTDSIISASVDLVHDIGMIDGACNKKLEEAYRKLSERAMTIHPDKWRETPSDVPGALPSFAEYFEQVAKSYLLKQYFVLDIAYDDADDYAMKEGEVNCAVV